MARPLRLEFSGACYHVTARGDRQEPIFESEDDYLVFIDLLAKEVRQQNWLLYAFCLMGNHYHLLLETPEPSLVKGMRRLMAFTRKPSTAAMGEWATCCKDATSPSWSIRIVIYWSFAATLCSIPCELGWFPRWQIGGGAAIWR